MTDLPELHELHLRHVGLTKALCEAYAEAASVCLSRHHIAPTDFDVETGGTSISRNVTWTSPSSRTKAAWNNVDDATRDGAYAVCISAMESALGLFAFRRAETRTGADYYMGPIDTDSLEDAYRLEISGVDHGDDNTVRGRLRVKVAQCESAPSNLPGIAAVVGFRVKRIAIETVIVSHV